mgnify:CR=1 FL=1
MKYNKFYPSKLRSWYQNLELFSKTITMSQNINERSFKIDQNIIYRSYLYIKFIGYFDYL